ncbi:hypothetical protein DFQ28_005750 [Apophysomyces sp. BC1034]|nr:hypothetical protein DFQ28_005750 [Apophysomyces sp. BC1034]
MQVLFVAFSRVATGGGVRDRAGPVMVRSALACPAIERGIARACKNPAHANQKVPKRALLELTDHDERQKSNHCDEYGVWPLIADDLSSRLPLKNLKWQPSSQRSERFIQSLEVDLKRFNFEQTPQPLSSMQATYLNLYFIACDDNEIYKNKVRRQIRQWVDLIMTKKNQEWLIVYVAGQDAKKSNSYLGLKTSVYDKIRTDFNQGKQDRCVYIRIHDPDGPGSELWAGFVEKMKDCILSSFDMQVLQIQEDTRRLDMQRHMPGWNYCTFFILKEGLAQAFEIMTLYEEALIQYDELEASFFQVLRDKALAWFGHFGGTDAGDDSGNILDFKRKDYRDLINKNLSIRKAVSNAIEAP